MIDNIPHSWRPANPSGFLPYYGASKKLLEFAENNGCPEIISGQGGDQVFCAQQYDESLADYWLDQGLRGITKPLKQMSAEYRSPYWSIIKKSLTALKYHHTDHALLIDRYDPNMRKNMLISVDHTPFYLDELLKEYYPAKALHIKSLAAAISYGDRDQRFQDAIVTLPLLSQPLVEYALKIPAYRTLTENYSRYFYRKAISRLTKSPVIWRKLKGEVSSSSLKGYMKDFDLIKTLVYEGKLLKQGIISREWVDEQLQKIRYGIGKQLIPFRRVISCELWFQQWDL